MLLEHTLTQTAAPPMQKIRGLHGSCLYITKSAHTRPNLHHFLGQGLARGFAAYLLSWKALSFLLAGQVDASFLFVGRPN